MGTWAAAGGSTAIDESYVDAGYLIHVTGTNTPLAAEVVVTVDGTAVTVDAHDAFAFELTVTRTAP